MIAGKQNWSLAVLRKAFDSFDRDKSGSIPTDMVADILRLMGQPFNKKILDELIDEVDADSEYRADTPKIYHIVIQFIQLLVAVQIF